MKNMMDNLNPNITELEKRQFQYLRDHINDDTIFPLECRLDGKRVVCIVEITPSDEVGYLDTRPLFFLNNLDFNSKLKLPYGKNEEKKL